LKQLGAVTRRFDDRLEEILLDHTEARGLDLGDQVVGVELGGGGVERGLSGTGGFGGSGFQRSGGFSSRSGSSFGSSGGFSFGRGLGGSLGSSGLCSSSLGGVFVLSGGDGGLFFLLSLVIIVAEPSCEQDDNGGKCSTHFYTYE